MRRSVRAPCRHINARNFNLITGLRFRRQFRTPANRSHRQHRKLEYRKSAGAVLAANFLDYPNEAATKAPARFVYTLTHTHSF